MPTRLVLLTSASGVKPKSIRTFRVSLPRRDSTCIDKPNSLISVLPGGLPPPMPQPKCSMSTSNTSAGRYSELITVDDHAHCHAIDLRNFAGDCFCAYWLRAADQRRHNGAEKGSTAAAHHIASMNCVALAN